MSARIDPDATETIEIPCPCEGTPHEIDIVTVRSEYGYGDLTDIQRASLRFIPSHNQDGSATVVTVTDPEQEHYALLGIAVKAWTFLEDDGTPMTLDVATIRTLRDDIGNKIAARVNALYLDALKRQALPNPSGGPSPHSSPESSPAGPNRATRRATRRSRPRSSSAPAGPTTT
ncbi:MAG: hypothetical protein M3N43_14725 [Actinomycetota bacterium]|nr:hypothetical protein [Actinomycetota bacterium]